MISRKNLRLPEYDYSSGGAYFVTVCTKNKECTLGHVVGGDVHIAPHTALSPLGQICEQVFSRMPFLVTYVIMPNHVHWVVQFPDHITHSPKFHQASAASSAGPMWTSAPTPKDESAAGTFAPHTAPSYTLGSLVRSFKTLVTKAHGAPVWQRSYYEHIIRNDADFLSIYRYIQDNPARWADDRFYQ